MIKKSFFLFIVFWPVFVFAQKGTIIPDTKPQSSSVNTANETKTWMIEDYLLDCKDTTKCYLVKENGINKTVPVEDIYNFDYQEGLKYTVSVKEELKTPPISATAGIYKYKVIKIISKTEPISATTNTPVTVSTTNETATSNASIVPTENENTNLYNEIEKLKKQVEDLKKQVEVLRLQIELQLQLMQKK